MVTAAGGTHPTGMHSCIRCCDMSQYDTIGKIELIPAFVLSTGKTNCKNDIHKFLQQFE